MKFLMKSVRFLTRTSWEGGGETWGGGQGEGGQGEGGGEGGEEWGRRELRGWGGKERGLTGNIVGNHSSVQQLTNLIKQCMEYSMQSRTSHYS